MTVSMKVKFLILQNNPFTTPDLHNFRISGKEL